MLRGLFGIVLVGGLAGCSRPSIAPSDESLPRPDRDGCPRFGQLTLLVSIPMEDRRFDYLGQFCEPIEDALRKRGLGRSQMGDVLAQPNGESHRVCSFLTSDPDDALGVIRATLTSGGAPKRTVVSEICDGTGAVHEI